MRGTLRLLAFVLHRLAEATACKGRMWSQFLMQIGRLLDDLFVGEWTAVAKGDLDPAKAFLQDMGWDSPQTTASNLKKYMLAAHAACRNTTMLSISADDSRVGGKARMAAAAVFPNNVAFWLPPQVATLLAVAASRTRNKQAMQTH